MASNERLSLADQLRAFNEARKHEFGRAPLPDERLPIPHTFVGGDLPDDEPVDEIPSS